VLGERREEGRAGVDEQREAMGQGIGLLVGQGFLLGYRPSVLLALGVDIFPKIIGFSRVQILFLKLSSSTTAPQRPARHRNDQLPQESPIVPQISALATSPK
jgi:hypothetical protein